MDHLKQAEELTLEKSNRLGLGLYTLYSGSKPLGSLLLDPIEDLDIVNELPEFIRRISEARKQKAERERIESDIQRGRNYYKKDESGRN